jgi:hypothetical protein
MLKRGIALLLLPLLAMVCNPISSIQPGVSSSSNHPLDVHVTLDSGQSVTQTITPEGGTLEATAQDGTHFTLAIPKDALLDDVDITMTPVKGIDNIPLSNKSLAAVQLAPEGMNLLQPATLVIKTTTTIPVKELVSFAYLGEGKDLHLFPLEGNPAEMTFQILHFSGYGTGQGNSSDLDKYPPGSGESTAESQGADIMKDVSNHGGGFTDADKTKLCKVILDWYNASVIGDLEEAETDSSSLYAAGGQFMRWLYDSQLFSCEHEAEIKEGKQTLAKGIDNAYHEAVPACEVKLMYQWSKWAYTLGLLSYAPDLAWDPYVKEDIEKCQVFDIDIEGVLTPRTAHGETITFQQGTAHLRRTGAGSFVGSVEVQATFDPPVEGCTSTDQPTAVFNIKAENTDELVHKNSIFDVTVEFTFKWATTITCGDVTRSVSPSATAMPEFQMPALDGYQHVWKSDFMDGGITFTFRDPEGYLEQIGKANWK